MNKNWLYLLLCIAMISLLVVGARLIETDFGRVQVSVVRFLSADGITLAGKLYVPDGASATNQLPGVLALHGFQNDKETQDAYAIELSRRGFVVLSLDQFGHGDSGGSMFLETSDPALGGDAGYDYLAALPYVDAENLGVIGHSMGAGNAVAVAQANPDHRAVNPQCGSAGGPELHNVLLTQALFEEFRGFRENQPRVEGLTTNADRLASFGLSGPVEWDTIYGDFADGSARMQTLIPTVHPGITHNAKAVAQTVLWMQSALKGGVEDGYWSDPARQIFMWKEWFSLLALLVALASMIPLTNLLMGSAFFAAVAQPVSTSHAPAAGRRVRNALVNNLIAGLTFPLLAAAGAFLISALVPSLTMIIANGIGLWLLLNALIYLIMFAVWYRKARKQGFTLADAGLLYDGDRPRMRWGLLGRTVLLGFLLLAWLYLLTAISQRATGIEFRFLWPFLREFSAARFGLFWVYLIPALAFFLLNGGVFLFGQNAQKPASSPARTQLTWWLNNCAAGLLGFVLIWVIQYLPYLLGGPPGFEAIGLPLFGEMIPLLMFVYIPEFVVLFFFLTWFYRRTGKVYLGALVIAALAIWFLVGGTAM